MKTTRTSTELAVVLAAMALVATAGCTNGTAESSASTTASVSPTPTSTVDPDDPQAVAYAEASAAYEEYFDLAQDTKQKPAVEGWGDLMNYVSGDVGTALHAMYTAWSDDPYPPQIGVAEAVAVTPTGYMPPVTDPGSTGTRWVSLDVCMDWKGVKADNGANMPPVVGEVMAYPVTLPERLLVTYTIAGWPQYAGSEVPEEWDWWVDTDPEIWWTVDKAEIHGDQTC